MARSHCQGKLKAMAVEPRDAIHIITITITMTPSLATRDGPFGSFPFEKSQPTLDTVT